MLLLSGYQIGEQIYTGTRTLVYRGVREQDQKPVVIKLLRRDFPTVSELIQFRNQYIITKNLDIDGIVKTYTLENYQNSYALVMEDFGGVSLKEYTIATPLNLTDFFAIALQIVTILNELYHKRIIHKDIKPANILINPTTKQIKLIDFSIASSLSRETQAPICPNVLEGTLAYISPEQTGRMNRIVDWRSDFYSLGATFYELLTGQLPFITNDLMELVYCHLAKQPPLVHSVNTEVPSVLSDIIAKLMAKNAEDRYQSALGLKDDLEQAYAAYQTGESTYFELGKRDIPDRFTIPEKLYGRESEIKTLLAAFDRVANPPISTKGGFKGVEMMLVAGYSGVGKTVIINEIHRPIAQQRGYFIKGKYDQFQRNIPLSGFVQAFRDLIQQLLSENDAQLKECRNNILTVLGEQAQIIIDVIPELEEIIGQQPPVTQLFGNAAANRFNLLFQKFIQIFTAKEHPLVIFIDDLQWADSASLKLIELVMQSDTQYLLLIGAYRDNEVPPGHPLMLTLDNIGKENIPINTIELQPLSLNNLNYLVADTLNCSYDTAISLTELIFQKTKGNPFFSNQLLKSLYEDGLIYFNPEKLYWQCQLSQIRESVLDDNVVEFLVSQLQKLPLATQEVMKLAACIGNQFDLKTLAIINNKSQASTASELWQALQEGLLIPTNEVYKFYQSEIEDADNNLGTLNGYYKFLHDRVQQAAYSLIPEEKKKSTHLNIGELLLNNIPVEKKEEKIFDIVNQLNYGINLINSQEKLEQIAHLNLIAGRKAKASTAYNAASQYFNTALEIISKDSWHQYSLALALYEGACDAAYLCGDYEKMEYFAQQVIAHGETLLDKIGTYEIKIQANIVQNKLSDALKIALDILKLIDIEFPDTPSQLDIQQAFQTTAAKLAGQKISDLINLPEMTDPNILAAMRILSSMFTAAYMGCAEFVPLVSLKMVDLSVQYGNTGLSANAYCTYGFLLCSIVGDIDAGCEFGQLSLNVLSKTNAKNSLQAKILLPYNSFIGLWKNPAKNFLKPLKEVYKIALEAGDLEYAAYALNNYCYLAYLTGQELTGIEKEMVAYCDKISHMKHTMTLHSLQIWQQTVLNLTDKSQNVCYLSGDVYDEEIMLPVHEENNYVMAIAIINFNKLILNYLFGNLSLALSCSLEVEQRLSSLTGSLIIPNFYLYDSLVRLAAFYDVTPAEQNHFLEKVNFNQEKMKHWANHAPMNFLHKYYLVEAERYRVLGEKTTAMEYYDKAISLAKENNYIQEEALANELAAKFYLDWNKQTIGQTYLINSYYCYARWGALAKVHDLEERYSALLASLRQPEIVNLSFDPKETVSINSQIEKTATGSTKILGAIDLASFIKASQAISSEIELDKLLVKLMQILLENAGATKAVLILPKSDKLMIEATISTNSVITVLQSVPLEESKDVPINLINYISRTRKIIIFNDAVAEIGNSKSEFKQLDPYIFDFKPKSLLCNPILNQGKLIAILYLENNLNVGAFTQDRLEIINLLCSQAAISLENASLYQQSQDYAQQLKYSFENLKQAQLQLIQSEKMSALGNLVSGIGHEINNPVGFLAGNIQPTRDYVQDLLILIDLYQKHYPNPVTEIAREITARDIEFVKQDLPKVIFSMGQAVDRIYDISISLRTFSRADTQKKILYNIHEGIDSTLMILRHRLKASNIRPEIEVVRNYCELPQVECFPGQLNQVFMNLLANAIDALEESNIGHSYDEIIIAPNRITITTEVNYAQEQVIISIQDNGSGMTPEIKAKIFDHLFTTKPVGQGTGLGLAIAYQIVVEKHCGKIEVNSAPNQGACFKIIIPV